MKLFDFIEESAIVPELANNKRDDAIREMIEALAAAGRVDPANVETLTKAVLQREKQGSTGFGKGVAVPHVKHECIKEMVATVGRSVSGIDFKALDRAPVYSMFLLLSPPDNPELHLQAMETIFRHLQRDNFRSFLRQAETTEAVVDLLQEADEMPGR